MRGKRQHIIAKCISIVTIALLAGLCICSAQGATDAKQRSPQAVDRGRAGAGPAVGADKRGYVVGETIQFAGSGFAPFEGVTLQAAHVDQAGRAGISFAPLAAVADAEGKFTVTWSLSPDDWSGNDFVMTAVGQASGSSARFGFKRIASLEADKRNYLLGETALITGSFFAPNEAVTLQVKSSDGTAEEALREDAWIVAADASGKITSTWQMNPRISEGRPLTLTATGHNSGLMAVAALNAISIGGFIIDGNVPDAAAAKNVFPDGYGSVSELGPVNSSATKLLAINTAFPPMLGLTNPNSQVDLRNIWMATNVVDGPTGKEAWLYFAWERDSSTGSGVISFEFQKEGRPAACDYSQPAQYLIGYCNPWRNRQEGDFLIVWDQNGSKINIIKRTFYINPSTGQLALNQGEILDPSSAVAVVGPTGFMGEAAIKITGAILPYPPTQCWSAGNIIPGTITGNSDSADYKDTVFASFTEFVSVSNCGEVKITKATIPDGIVNDRIFSYTLMRTNGFPIKFPLVGGLTSISGALASLYPNSIDDQIDLIVANNYFLIEKDPGADWRKTSISCTVPATTTTPSNTYDVYPGSEPFPLYPSTITECKITNTKRPKLTVIKNVINDNGGTKQAYDFTMNVTGANVSQASFAGAESPGTTVTLDVGNYSVVETGPSGYSASSSGCSGTIAAGETKTCTIINDDQPGTLTIKKTVQNNHGGKLGCSDFSFSVNGGTPISFEADCQNDIPIGAGTYTVTEPATLGYATTYKTCSDLVIANGGSATCTITNSDQQGILTVKKVVQNHYGGSLGCSNFSFSVNGGTPISFEADCQNDIPINAGTYTVTESATPGYTTAYGACSDLVITNGASATCTITNSDKPATLTVKKVVINNSGLHLGCKDFSFSVNGGAPVPFEADCQNDIPVSAGTYSITEAAVTGYTVTYNGCNNVVLTNGGSATCTISNDDEQETLSSGMTQQSWILKDSATIYDMRTSTDATCGLAGTVTFTLWNNAACTGTPVTSQTVDLSIVNRTGTAQTGGISVSAGITYYWTVQYNGNACNARFTVANCSESTLITAKDK